MANASTPLQVTFDRLHCFSETTETGSDDPYLLFVVSDLRATRVVSGISFDVPQTGVWITDTFSMGEGDTRRQGDGQAGNRRDLGLLWGTDGKTRRQISDSDAVLILVALVESDGGTRVTKSVLNVAESVIPANVIAYVRAGLPRRELVRKLAQDIRGAIKLGAAKGLMPDGLGEDECIGVAEFRLTESRLQRARTRAGFLGHVHLGRGSFGQGAFYRAYLRVSPR